MRLLVLLLTLTILLGACVTTSSEPTCPREKVYTPQFQERLADQLITLPPGSPVVTAMIDYGDLRAQVRACRGE